MPQILFPNGRRRRPKGATEGGAPPQDKGNAAEGRCFASISRIRIRSILMQIFGHFGLYWGVPEGQGFIYDFKKCITLYFFITWWKISKCTALNSFIADTIYCRTCSLLQQNNLLALGKKKKIILKLQLDFKVYNDDFTNVFAYITINYLFYSILDYLPYSGPIHYQREPRHTWATHAFHYAMHSFEKKS